MIDHLPELTFPQIKQSIVEVYLEPCQKFEVECFCENN